MFNFELANSSPVLYQFMARQISSKRKREGSHLLLPPSLWEGETNGIITPSPPTTTAKGENRRGRVERANERTSKILNLMIKKVAVESSRGRRNGAAHLFWVVIMGGPPPPSLQYVASAKKGTYGCLCRSGTSFILWQELRFFGGCLHDHDFCVFCLRGKMNRFGPIEVGIVNLIFEEILIFLRVKPFHISSCSRTQTSLIQVLLHSSTPLV